MSLKQQLTDDMKQAMRDRDAKKLETIRYAIAQIKNLEIDKGELDEVAVQVVIKKIGKQIKESISEFTKGDRLDLVEEEEAKLKIMEAYLPEEMGDQDLEKIVDTALATHGENMGAIMGQVMKEVKGLADGGRVTQMVQSKLKQ
jgi:uncharacterized protein